MSNDYIYRCAEVILNDKNLSETTIVTMFLEYKRLLYEEFKNQYANNQNISKRPSDRR
jgi:hypothetical protein